MRLPLAVLILIVSTAHAAEPDPAKKELAGFQGEWTVESMQYNGKEMKDRYKISFQCKNDMMTVEGDGKVKKEYAKLTLKPDGTTTPKCVDMIVAGGVQKDAKLEGIYELKDDELRICVKVFGMDRPTEFKSPDGSSVALLVLKKKK